MHFLVLFCLSASDVLLAIFSIACDFEAREMLDVRYSVSCFSDEVDIDVCM
jgi:hypothetical protein